MITDIHKAVAEYSQGCISVPTLIPALCDRCYNCINVCPVSAISLITEMACSKCVKYCIIMDVPCYRDKPGFNYQSCNSCGKCVETCSSHAISWIHRKETP